MSDAETSAPTRRPRVPVPPSLFRPSSFAEHSDHPAPPAATAVTGLTVPLQPPSSTDNVPSSLAQTRCFSFPTVIGRQGAEVHLFDGLISQNTHEVLLLKRGYYGIRLCNNNETAWDSLYLGIGKMRLVADLELTECPPDSPLLLQEGDPIPDDSVNNNMINSPINEDSPDTNKSSDSIDSSETHIGESSEVIVSEGHPKRQLICRAQQEKMFYFYCSKAQRLLRLSVYGSLSLGMRLKGSYDLLYCSDRRLHPEKPLTPFRRPAAILTLDGGGILGISSLKILERIELELQRKLNDPGARLVDCFDMIAGTSTGGIIALGLMTGMSISEMLTMWASMSGRIFEGNRTLFSGIFFEGYDVAKLKNALGQSLGQRFLNTYKGPYCFVTATDVKTNPYQLVLLRNYRHKHLCNHEYRGVTALPVWTAAWATSAAPTFLRGPTPEELEKMGLLMVPEVQLCDGAMMANNPTMVALEEAARLGGKKLRQFIESDLQCVLSVGTGQPTLRQTIERGSGTVSTFQILLNSTHLLTSATSTHRDVLHWMADHEENYYRFNVPGIGDIPLDAIDKSSFDIILKATNDYLTDEKYFDMRRLTDLLASRYR